MMRGRWAGGKMLELLGGGGMLQLLDGWARSVEEENRLCLAGRFVVAG
jgi:hypothetical protein